MAKYSSELQKYQQDVNREVTINKIQILQEYHRNCKFNAELTRQSSLLDKSNRGRYCCNNLIDMKKNRLNINNGLM